MPKKKASKATGSTRKSPSSTASTSKAGRTTRKSAKKTAKKTTTRKAASHASTDAGAGPESRPPKKSPLSAKDQERYRKMLFEKRAELLGDVCSMSEEALRSDSTNLSHMPIHMADVSSDNYGKELMLGLVESERRLLKEIDEALDRIEQGVFGICEATGKPIAKARLNVTPWARYCIEAARERERNNNHPH